MADEFRVHRDVDELLRLLGNASGAPSGEDPTSAGGGAAGKDVFVEELNRERTPYVSTQVGDYTG